MITNLYKEVLLRHQQGATYQELSVMLSNANIVVFGGLYRLFNDDAIKVLLYIIHAYSEDSQKLVVGADSQKNKKDILDLLEMRDVIRIEILSYSNEELNNVIINYLNYQASSEFKHLKMTEDIYEKLFDETYRALSGKEEDSNNFDQKKVSDNYKQLSDMRSQKNALKEEIKVKYAYVYENLKEIELSKRKNRLDPNVEGSREIKS